MKTKIPILGVTREVETYERNVINYLKNDLLQTNSDLQLIDVSFYDSISDKAMSTIAESSNKVILLTDACIGNSLEYESVVKELYDRNIKPLLLITHIESSETDLDDVSLIPTNIVGYHDKKAEWYHNVYDSLLFNYDSKHFYNKATQVYTTTTTGIEEGQDIHLLVNTIKEYLSA